ncbi:MAG: tRNA (guanosine(37)-N1)-methyltransferase TrmD [Clostridia bacterium]|nr:tRNA (guanosine(37)-N1)-methyltransferase TrmD [Clostridia bacterium]
MRFDIMTLFPALVENVLSESILGRAERAGLIEVHAYNIRDYSKDKHRRVDDTPYGGGKGMLMSPVPIYDCYLDVVSPEKNPSARRRVIYMSPQGSVFTQAKARELAENYDDLIFLCGHYEGVDQRIIDEIVDEELSIGDYVLTGGEIPACIIVDAVARLIPGVLADAECYEKESFTDENLLEYPQYTRPYDFRGRTVPEVLLSGHHANIEKWREEKALEKTRAVRPELYEKKMQELTLLDAQKKKKKTKRENP